MIALLIILALLILLMLTKVGVIAAYENKSPYLAVKFGVIRLQLLPKPKIREKPKKQKEKKPKKERAKKEKPEKEKQAPDISFMLSLAKVGLHALNRFRIRLRIDVFRLRFIMASSDPYTTATTYGYLQSAVSMLAPLVRRTFTVRDSRVELGADFLGTKPEFEGKLVLTIRIGRVIGVLIATGLEFLRLILERKLRKKREQKSADKSRDPEQEDAQPAQKSA